METLEEGNAYTSEHAFISWKKKMDKIDNNRNHWWIAEDRIYTAQRLLPAFPKPEYS
jgi:hypothetical protein